jgi:hypothetical protein
MDFLVNTGYKQGKPGMSKIFFAALDQITAQPEPPTTGTTPGATSTATGSWTFATRVDYTNGFVDLKNDLLKGSKIEFTFDGDPASPSEKTKIMCKVIGFDAEIIERVRQMAGTPMTFAVKGPDCTSTEYWIVGCTCGAAYAKPKGDTDYLGGTTGKGFEFEIEANCAPYKWSGTLPLLTETP